MVCKLTDAESIRVKGAMVRNVLRRAALGKSLLHLALVTGLKHYLRPSKLMKNEVCLSTVPAEQPRLDNAKFYYAKDEVFAAAERRRRLVGASAPTPS